MCPQNIVLIKKLSTVMCALNYWLLIPKKCSICNLQPPMGLHITCLWSIFCTKQILFTILHERGRCKPTNWIRGYQKKNQKTKVEEKEIYWPNMSMGKMIKILLFTKKLQLTARIFKITFKCSFVEIQKISQILKQNYLLGVMNW